MGNAANIQRDMKSFLDAATSGIEAVASKIIQGLHNFQTALNAQFSWLQKNAEELSALSNKTKEICTPKAEKEKVRKAKEAEEVFAPTLGGSGDNTSSS